MIGQTAINIVLAVDSKFVLLLTIFGEYTGYLIVAKHGSRPGFQQKDWPSDPVTISTIRLPSPNGSS